MTPRATTLALPQPLYRRLRTHLFPGDGLEAAALLLCTIVEGRRVKLLARDLVEVPYAACARRTRDSLTWSGDFVEEAIAQAEQLDLAIVATHSHPGGLFAFSDLDDESDRALMPALYHGTNKMCGSAIMTPSGAMRARLYNISGIPSDIDLVMCPGHDLDLWWAMSASGTLQRPLAFTSEMTDWLGRLSVCVIGVSGTGSIVAEQLARLGIGEIILIDFDKIEFKNLNRILNSTTAHATAEALKVDVFADAIGLYRPGCSVLRVPYSIATRDAVLAASDADLLFCCVDTAEGRHIADRLAAYLLLPLFDVGVSIPTRQTVAERRTISEVCGRIDYVFPGGSTLQDRSVYDPAMLEAEYLARAAPETLQRKLNDGYLRGVGEQAPAVISLNMRAASSCVMEFIARAFPFRHIANEERARTIFTLCEGDEDFFAEADFASSGQFPLGLGLKQPLLGLPALLKSRGS